MYYGKLFKKDTNNSKKTWKHINELLNRNKSAPTCKDKTIEKIEYEFDGELNEFTSSIDIANVLNNDFFVNIGQNLANKIDDSNVNYTDYLDARQSKTLLFLPVISAEVKDVIRKMDQSKACGYDNPLS